MSTMGLAARLGGFGVIGLAVLALILVLAGIQIVPDGKVKTVSNLGQVQDAELEPGFHVINPITQSTRAYTVQSQTYTMSAGEGDRTVQALTQEGLNLETLDISVRYHLKGDSASVIHKELGKEEAIIGELLKPSIRTAVRQCTANYKASRIYNEGRDTLPECIHNRTEDELASGGDAKSDRDFNNHLVIETVQVRNIMLPQRVREKIQTKENVNQQIEIEEKQIEVAKKEKKRKRIQAEADAQANDIRDRSLTQAVLDKKFIQAIENGDVNVVYLGNERPSFVENVDKNQTVE